MQADHGSHRRGATQELDDRSRRFHAEVCSAYRYDPQVLVANLGTDFSYEADYACAMMSDWVSQAIDFASTDQAKLARAMSQLLHRSIDRAAVNKLTLGTRKLQVDELFAIARLTGYPLPREYDSIVPVVGLVGADVSGIIQFCDDGILGRVSLPPWGSTKTVAVEVRGISMRGVAENGWFVYYDKRENGVEDGLLGQMCVVGLADGRTLIKTPRRGTEKHLFHLESASAPLLEDQHVIWASPITAIVPPAVAKMVPDLS